MPNPDKKPTAIVTGGARGLGRGISQRLTKDGFAVVVWDRKVDDFDANAAGLDPSLVMAVDVSDEKSVSQAMANVIRLRGGVDLLVNNAGIAVPAVPVWEYDLATWNKVIAVNLTGVFLCSRAVAPHMRAAKSGRIINIASVSSKQGGFNICAYASSKGGVVALTKSLAKELAADGILVNAVTPSAIETDLLMSTGPLHVEAVRKRVPLGRLGSVGELAGMVSFIAGKDCTFSTGAIFDMSGGVSAY